MVLVENFEELDWVILNGYSLQGIYDFSEIGSGTGNWWEAIDNNFEQALHAIKLFFIVHKLISV